MLLGATVLCGLVLLALVCDVIAGRLWRGGKSRAFYRCEPCDLLYPVRGGAGVPLACPAGHELVPEAPAGGRGAGVIAICICCGFLAVSITLMVTGVVPS